MIEAFPFDSGSRSPAATRRAAADSHDLFLLNWADLSARFSAVQELRRSYVGAATRVSNRQGGSFARMGQTPLGGEITNKNAFAVNPTNLADIKPNRLELKYHEAEPSGDKQVNIENNDD